MIFLFWACGFFIAHTYLLYPISLSILSKIFPPSSKKAKAKPYKVSILISAYNEEKILEEKIQNCLALDYLPNQIEVLIGSDGSNDGTNDILSKYQTHPIIKGFPFEERSGKAAVLNRLAKAATGDVFVFCDANSMFLNNTIQKLLVGFQEENVGCICGRLILKDNTNTSLGKGESIYWTMESEIKRAEGKLGIVLGSNGAIYAIKKELYEEIPIHTKIMDDFYIAIKILMKGHKTIYEPMAIATEETSVDKYGEFKRKVRIGEANFNMLPEYLKLLNLKHPFVAYSFFSHKMLRWLAPNFLILIFILNIAILFHSNSSLIYFIIMFLQPLFYGMAGIGAIMNHFHLRAPIFITIPFYFVSMNAALFLGMIKSFFGSKQATWERVERTSAN